MKEGGISHGFDNHFNDTINILQYIVIPEPHDIEALIPQPSISLTIVRCLLAMLSAVDLDDYPFSKQTKSTM